MKNTKNFFRQAVYTEELNENSIPGIFKILAQRILLDFKVEYNSLELKIRNIMEPKYEEELIGIKMFPPFALVKTNMFPTFASVLEILGTRQKNKFYPANPSLWIVFVSCFMGVLVILFVSILHSQEFISSVYKQFFIAILGSILCIVFWVSLFYNEKIYGYHTDIIRRNITLGFWLFLFTEGLCFMSLFWTFFHSLLAASTHIGQFAPGGGVINYFFSEAIIMHPYWNVFCYTDASSAKISNFYSGEVTRYTFDHLLTVKFHFNLFDGGQVIDPYGYPALNTALLLISAVLLNFSHVRLKSGKYLKSFIFLGLTLFFGLIFMGVQFLEIKGSTLQFNDGIYASSFYSLTGLHGIHVILGVFALFLCFINFLKGNYTRKRHDTFWCAVAYWHFVDVVWILVYLLIYCWPSCLYYSDIVRHSYLGYRDHCLNINIHVFEENLFQQVVLMKYNILFILVNFYSYEQIENTKKITKSLKPFSFDAPFIFEKVKEHENRLERLNKYHVLIYALYHDLYKNKEHINYSELTTDKDLYAVFLNIFHTLAFDYLDKWFYSDFTTWRGKIKFPILIILYFININWAFTFAARFTPYLLNSDFECIWGDLLYTRKPKWLIKKE